MASDLLTALAVISLASAAIGSVLTGCAVAVHNDHRHDRDHDEEGHQQ